MQLVNSILSLLLLWTLALRYKLFWSEPCTAFLSPAQRETPEVGKHQPYRWPHAETQLNGDQRTETAQQSCGGGEDEGGSILEDQA